jgi:hypothetical protein
VTGGTTILINGRRRIQNSREALHQIYHQIMCFIGRKNTVVDDHDPLWQEERCIVARYPYLSS